MKNRSRGKSNLRRKQRIRDEKPRILIITEGQQTEPQYFRGLSRELKATGIDIFRLDIVGLGKDPERLVREAVRRANKLPQVASDGGDYDHIWCVFDVDQHARLESAIQLANSCSIDTAISNPCFELWLLWHYEDRAAHVTATILRRQLRNYGFTGKNLPAGFPFSNYGRASERALKAISQDKDGRSNPYSSVHLLVALMAAETG